jgi:glutamyl-tRNA reductase
MAAALAEPLVVGVSHRSAAPALRDRLHLERAAVPSFLERMRAAGLAPGLVLSTCERTELELLDPGGDRAERALDLLAAQAGIGRAELAEQSYRLAGESALRHIFAVASSLDSLIPGEPQILGQLKLAHRLAAAAGLVEDGLAAVLRAAYGAAKRVRRETAVAQRPVSIAASALQLARSVHGDLGRAQAVLLGIGEMGELMVRQLRRAGLQRVTVLHPVARRAALLAHRCGGHQRDWGELAEALAGADILVAALGAGGYTVDRAAVEAALRRRRRRPMLLLDAAVPGDLDPMIDSLSDAFRYDLGDLERVALQGQAERAAAAERGWAIVGEEVALFRQAQAGRRAVPAVVALRRHFEAVRAELLADGAGGVEAAEATRLLVNRLLHEPTELLRRAAAGEAGADDPTGTDRAALERAMARLFGLPRPPGDEEVG